MSLTFSITNYPTGISPSSVAIGDLNGDGRLDLVTANIGGDPLGTPTPAGTVSVLQGNGGGTFSAATPYPTGSVIRSSVAIGDLNGDGRLDLAVTNYGSPSSLVPAGTVSVFLGAGGGTLAAATQYPTGTGLPGAQSVAIGDLNGDGRLDLAVANSSSSISVLLGQAGGGFLTLSPRALSPVNNFSSVALADLNGDAKLDLAVTNYGSSPDDPGTVLVLLGNGNGTFGSPTVYPTGTNSSSVAIGDLNGDGRLDLAVANADSNTVSVLLGNVGGGFQQQTQYPTGLGPSSVAIRDLNGDGKLDLAVANADSNNVTVLLNDIAPPPIPPVPPGTTADMILRRADGTYEIYDIGNNSILAAAQLGQVGTDWKFVGLGGFFGSDTTDMLLRNANNGGFEVYDISNNKITNAAFLGAVGLDWQVMGFGDLNGDAKTDMALRNVNTGGIETYNISNNQIVGASFMGTVGLNWQFSGIGDFNGDGASDMMLRNANTGGLEVYDIANNQIAGAAFLGTVGLDWQFAGVAPVSGAGRSDLVLRNVNTGAFEVYNIANNQITGPALLGTVGLDWQLGGFAVDPPTASTGSSDGSTSQLVQAMAGFGGDAADDSNDVSLGADTSQQSFLTTSQ